MIHTFTISYYNLPYQKPPYTLYNGGRTLRGVLGKAGEEEASGVPSRCLAIENFKKKFLSKST